MWCSEPNITFIDQREDLRRNENEVMPEQASKQSDNRLSVR
ncbi:hypothetical protein ALQ08_102419 [Pseudomonas syringae pv. delphinii]|uniref:Uncharacterized protein n=5 Tax=Pseudomonas syringae group TaxID=136849 RepID=A0A0P9Q8B4_9PSED|nr:hypothetical protein ALO72_101910 [Pseudomonas syringae pv. delphinii]KPZ22016.1 hypothetical protein ALO40_101404 [Pseudomonas syringae pv. viburni]RML41611.1 hypothetical protein ALQ95_101319 [Pseudomonas syringae pv. ribicola]RMO79004.1 hypothetical protein ALQ36_101976 [Pseudomonas syringae pv. primulae]RMQ36520.1 hypothetical protein ALQ07_101584 [Pseudomonas syringae pv. actinidiae]